MDFFTLWKHFNSTFDRGNFTAHEQLVGYKLLTICNELRLPTEFRLSDRELQRRTSIKSTQTIVEARRWLKNAGLIDFKATKAGTVYRLLEPNTKQAQANRDSNTNQACGKHSSRDNYVSIPTLEPERQKTESASASAKGSEQDEWSKYRQY